MLLPDHEIDKLIQGGHIRIDPYEPKLINPCSLDVRLDRNFLVPKQSIHHLDTAAVEQGHMELVEADAFVIKPGEFALAATREIVTLPSSIAARVEGKSSVGRLGLSIHITAGWIDPGFDGQITLEVKNEAPWAITLHQNMRIAQLAFFEMTSSSEKPYNLTGRYLNQKRGPVESKYTIDPESD